MKKVDLSNTYAGLVIDSTQSIENYKPEILPFWIEEKRLVNDCLHLICKEDSDKREGEKYYLIGMSFLTGKDPHNQKVPQSEEVGLEYLETASKLGNEKAKFFLESDKN